MVKANQAAALRNKCTMTTKTPSEVTMRCCMSAKARRQSQRNHRAVTKARDAAEASARTNAAGSAGEAWGKTRKVRGVVAERVEVLRAAVGAEGSGRVAVAVSEMGWPAGFAAL